ncbi:MAG: hypothetical protein ACRC2R_07880 [Xenococcaceae cyanobacterium]
MNNQSQQLLESFDRLPEDEKQQVVAEILRRTLNTDIPSLTDDELTLSAEALFLSLDRWESDNS